MPASRDESPSFVRRHSSHNRGDRLMPNIIRIQDIAAHVGETVTLQGWLYNRVDKGKLQFLQVRDGTGIVQCVVFKKEVSEEIFAAASRLTQESSVEVTGAVRADPRAPGTPGGVELGV